MLASFGTFMVSVLVVVLSLLLIGLVLLQKNKGGGLSGAFGGVGGYSAFGTKTGDFLTWLTCGVTAVFLLLCVIGNWVFVPDYVDAANAATPTGQTPAGQMPPRPTPVNRPAGAAAPAPMQPTGKAQPGATPGKAVLIPTAKTPVAGQPAAPGAGATPPAKAAPPPSTQPGK